ncbi:Hypothetical predicted protein, partial [Pelobates cultripes]
MHAITGRIKAVEKDTLDLQAQKVALFTNHEELSQAQATMAHHLSTTKTRVNAGTSNYGVFQK